MNTLHPLVEAALGPVRNARGRLWLWKKISLWWLLLAATGGLLAVCIRHAGLSIPQARVLLVSASVLGSIAIWLQWKKLREDPVQIARSVEENDPRLKALLLTAVEQVPSNPDGSWGYLQEKVIESALKECLARPWSQPVIERVFLAQSRALVALLLLTASILYTPNLGLSQRIRPAVSSTEIVVTPGDAEVEKGQTVAVMIRFPGQPPGEAELIWVTPDGKEKRMAMVRNLNDPVFGTTLPALESDVRYQIRHGKTTTQNFALKVFEKPNLVRSDAHLFFPEYTGLGEQKVPDTRRITAVEGTRFNLDLKLNKPVQTATLVASNRPSIRLTVARDAAVASLKDYSLLTNSSYQLELVDQERRTNRLTSSFIFEATSNRPPEIKLIAPRGDSKVSPLEEVDFQASVRDDFGLVRAGLSYLIPGQLTNDIVLAQPQRSGGTNGYKAEALKPQDQRSSLKLTGTNSPNATNIHHTLHLEEKKVTPGTLIAWHFWAEDHGPDGKLRKTTGDLYFAEVRPFKEIYRQGDLAQQGGGGGGGGQQGNQATRLAELQKQILNATWKLQRQAGAGSPPKNFASDVGVVKDSQQKALEQLEEAGSRAQSERAKASVAEARKFMETAVDQLERAQRTPEALGLALTAEQSAYQAILKLSPREHQVVQNRQQGGGGGGENNQNNSELDQLDVKPNTDRYETQSQAASQQDSARNEDQQLLNRLKELAQRQQDLNERINELASARNRARTEAEKEEIDRKLKRLREEQRQMLEDVDEMAQRLEQNRGQENSNREDLRRQTQEARNQVREASDALDSQEVSDALAAGTRAQRQFQNMRDEVRKQASTQLEERLRQLRQQTRELVQKEGEINNQLRNAGDNKPRSLGAPSERESLSKALAEQAQKMTNLLSQASQISELAEGSEPVLSRQLYDALRETTQQDGRNITETRDELMRQGQLTRGAYELLEDARLNNRKPLEVASNLVRNGGLREGAALESKIFDQMQSLQRGVETASNQILGDDTEALRRARKELEALEEALARESQGTETNNSAQASAGASASPDGTGTNNLAGSAQSAGRSSTNQTMASNRPGGREGRQGQNTPQGQQPGEGRTPGQPSSEPGEGGQGEGRGQGQGQAQAANQAGNGRDGRGQGRETRQTSRRSLTDRAQQGSNRNGNRGDQQAGGQRNGGNTRGGGGGLDGDQRGPISGEEFGEWNTRLRNIEDGVDSPEIRNRIAGIRENMRELRINSRRHSRPPEAGTIRGQVITPLVEVRNRIQEELARRDSKDALVPLDRDPVPTRYSELVKRYYERLGRGN